MSIIPDAAREEAGTLNTGRTDGAQATVMRNTAFLMVAQVLGMPLTMLVNAVMARKLGPEEFGYIYLAGTLVAFGFLVVEWGQGSTLPAVIARKPALAGRLLATGMVWRVGSSFVVYGALTLTALLLGYGRDFQLVLLLVVLARLVGTTCAACLDTARGFERTSPQAYSQIRYNVLCAALVIPTLLLGGGLLSVLVALLLADVVNTVMVVRGLSSLPLGKLSLDRDVYKELMATGFTFMMLNLAASLQPNVDAVFLSKLGTPEAMGWYAAARKLVGVLAFPASALVGALYPTLCRLYAEDFVAYSKLTRTALRTSTTLVIPVALGAGLYPDIGIRIFSRDSFRPAEDNLRVLAAFIFLIYFTMVLGTAISAAGRQRVWTIVQFGCVGISAVVDPMLIPYFHTRYGNGGLGVCIASVLSEILMTGAAFMIAPKGMLDRQTIVRLALPVVAGGAMIAVAVLLRSWSPFISAPISVLGYAACLWMIGGIDKEQLSSLRATIARKAGRKPASP